MVIQKSFDVPNKWTFQIPSISRLLKKYVEDGKGWVDPFAGETSPAELTNDINPSRPTKYHLYADEFCKTIEGSFNGVLFDPPYSYRQITECYQDLNIRASQLDTSSNFYNRVMNAITPKIKLGGIAISFGWNSNGFGKSRGFRQLEILLVAHGGHHNDTICVVEEKIYEQQNLFD